jgi:hypothetical protein
MVLSPARLRPERDCTGDVQQQEQVTDPSSRQRGRYKITNAQLSKENQGERKIGRESQMGAWHRDGLADWMSAVI